MPKPACMAHTTHTPRVHRIHPTNIKHQTSTTNYHHDHHHRPPTNHHHDHHSTAHSTAQTLLSGKRQFSKWSFPALQKPCQKNWSIHCCRESSTPTYHTIDYHIISTHKQHQTRLPPNLAKALQRSPYTKQIASTALRWRSRQPAGVWNLIFSAKPRILDVTQSSVPAPQNRKKQQ